MREALQRRTVFYVNDPVALAIDQAAHDRMLTASSWMRMAVLGQLAVEGHQPPTPPFSHMNLKEPELAAT